MFAFYTLFTSKIIIMPTVNNTPIVFIVLQPYSIAEKDLKHNNRPKKCTYPQVENITILPKLLFSLKNTITCLLKRQQYRSNRVGHFLRCVSMVFYNQKSFVRRRLRRCRLRHKIHAIKTRPNNPLRFLQRKNSIRRYLANDLTCVARKATFRTQKRFHNKQYTPNQKINLLNQRTHFDIWFNNGNLQCTVRPLFFFLLTKPHQSTAKSITKTTTTNNPKSLNQKHAQNKHNKQLRQNAMFLNIKISQKATTSKQTTNTLFIKTQYNNKKQSNILPLR